MATFSFNGLETATVKIGNAGEIAVQMNRLNEEVLAHIFNYGLKQILNDTRSAEKDSEKAMALVEKKLQALYEGKVRAAGERETDPVRAEARKIATGKLDALLRGRKIKKEDLAEGLYAAKVKELMGKTEIMELAKANVEAAKGLSVDDDILAGL